MIELLSREHIGRLLPPERVDTVLAWAAALPKRYAMYTPEGKLDPTLHLPEDRTVDGLTIEQIKQSTEGDLSIIVTAERWPLRIAKNLEGKIAVAQVRQQTKMIPFTEWVDL